MRAVGEVLHGLAPDRDAAPSAPSVPALVPAERRGGEVVLPRAPAPLPALPDDLAARAALEAEPVEDRGVAVGEREDGTTIYEPPARIVSVVPAHWKPAAERAAAELRAMLAQRADPRTIEAWLRRIAATVANPPAGEAWRARAAALVDMLGEEPALCFTIESARLACRRFSWFPSGAELAAFCGEAAAPYRARLRGLERVAWARTASGPGREAPPELPAAMRAGAAALAAELAGRVAFDADEPEPRRPPRPAYASPAAVEAMLADSVARGGALSAASAARLKALRSRRDGDNAGLEPA